MTSRVYRRLLVACLYIALMSGCGQPADVVLVVKPVIDPGQMSFQGRVDIGGRKLFLECAGIGEPAVIFDAGLQSAGWKPAALVAELSAVTRVCLYDRPNTPNGRSDHVQAARTSQDIVDDLDALLAVAGVRPPWILVGHGFGGMNMTLFAAQHTDQVTGLILMDPMPPNTIERWTMMLKFSEPTVMPTAYQQPIADLAHGVAENIDLAASTEQLRSMPGLGRMPVRLFAARRPLEGWTTIDDPALRERLTEAWKDGRDFYNRVAPGIRVYDVDDGNGLMSSDSEELIRDEVIALLIRYRTCCGPLV